MSTRAAIRSLLPLVALLSLVQATAAHAATFTPVADAYVDSTDATTSAANFGTRTYLRVDNSPVTRGYLRFNVQGAGTPASAALRFYVGSSNSTGIEVRAVSDTTWGETSITFNNAPPVGTVLGTTGPIAAAGWLTVDVSPAVTGDGPVSFALTTTSNTRMNVTSRDGTNKPELLVPAPASPPTSPSTYVVSNVGASYQAQSQTNGTTFTGSAKFVVESAVADLMRYGGGTVRFTTGTFDLGSDYFRLRNTANVTFEGAGIDATIIRNFSTAAADTEPFNMGGVDHDLVVQDLTVSAGGPLRSTSDALDFDNGNNIVVRRVKITASRARGIVFDGKDAGAQARNNLVENCVITGVQTDGIELLATNSSRVQGCTITNVGGHGIQLAKASSSAAQANKKSTDNLITANVIDQSGQDGINVTSGDNNQITNNTVTNSANVTAGRDGIRITSESSITCNDNVVSGNTATDNQAVKTQKYGLNITSSLCNRTVVGPGNDFTGNLTAPIRNAGTGTIFR